jgi:hypothetical protein
VRWVCFELGVGRKEQFTASLVVVAGNHELNRAKLVVGVHVSEQPQAAAEIGLFFKKVMKKSG